ncbi:MAG: PilZ domain-containing protein [Sedimentisphaerales bacterium]|nr:PilZ domain-containing protein [Sedimentisphaerales bacterium]
MKRNIRNDRRSDERRKSKERRGLKRRKYDRLVYPHTCAPKVLNANFSIIDISENGISFVCRDDCNECKEHISLNSIINLKIQFHDKETIDIEVEIQRCERSLHSQERTYAGHVKKGITPERIAKEEAYLKSNFPGFVWSSSELL